MKTNKFKYMYATVIDGYLVGGYSRKKVLNLAKKSGYIYTVAPTPQALMVEKNTRVWIAQAPGQEACVLNFTREDAREVARNYRKEHNQSLRIFPGSVVGYSELQG